MKGVLQKRSTFTQRARMNTRSVGRVSVNPPAADKKPNTKKQNQGIPVSHSRGFRHGVVPKTKTGIPPVSRPLLCSCSLSAAAPSPPFFPLLLLCHFAVNSRYHGEDRGCAVSSSWALQDALCLSWLVALGFLCSLSLSLSFELMAF